MSNALDKFCEIQREIFLADFAEYDPQVFTIDINPVPASRPRVTKNGTHFLKKYENYKGKALVRCNDFKGNHCGDKPVIAFVEHVIDRTDKRLIPNGDIDNYDKGPLDSMVKSGKFFNDDVQVVGLSSVKRYAEEGELSCAHIIWFSFTL